MKARAKEADHERGHRVGETRVAREFFAGQYASVVLRTFDAQTARLDDVDVAFTVGALTFLGRIEDAQICYDAWRLRVSEHDGRTLAAARFFLGVAHARSGDFERAYGLLVRGIRRRLRTADAWCRAFAFQGLACQRYFTGHYRAAAGHAQRALRAAHVESFPYVKMLSTDLRGHALVQIGQLRAGLGLLEQAKSHAERLGFALNAYAIECSIATYAAKFVIGDEVVAHLERLLGSRSHDSYSRHALLTELSIQLALRGRRSDAENALREAEEHALEIDARRAKVTSLLARLHVTRWSAGTLGCRELVEQTSHFVDEGDAAFRAELLGFDLLVARASNDDASSRQAESALNALIRSHDLYWARAALERAGAGQVRTRPFFEDQLTPILRAVALREAHALHRLLSERLLGAIPELLGLEPGRRVIIFRAESSVLLENHGDLVLRKHPPRWCPTLLRLLARGEVSKEVIVKTLWGLRRYSPERHDTLLRTTIHRLRTFLEPYGDWVRVTANGYGTSVPVLFIGEDEVELEEAEIPLEEEEVPTIEARRANIAPAREVPKGASALVRAKLLELGHGSVTELADAAGVSNSTALRALQDLVAERSRSGQGMRGRRVTPFAKTNERPVRPPPAFVWRVSPGTSIL